MLLGREPTHFRAGSADDHHGACFADLRRVSRFIAPRDIKRLFAYSSTRAHGIIAFAFGMGGPLANFAGLLHMTMHQSHQIGNFLYWSGTSRR